MKKILVIGLVGMFIFTGCGDDDTTEDMMIDTRFESELVGMDDMEILIDTETNLVWVNDIRGCFAGIINPEMECGMLVFAGRDDWRTPTSAEMSALISAIAEREMELNYINSACSLMSTSDGVWVFTENTDMPGGTTMMMPGNAGLRCVAMN
jgi:hypothetical protein